MTEKEKTPEQLELERKQLLFAQLQKLKLIDLDLYPYRTQEKIIGKYTREQLKKALEAPELDANQVQLRNISKFLYNASSHYKRLVLYFAELLTLDHYIEPYMIDIDKVNKKKIKKAYFDTLNFIENMNIKHEFSKVLHSSFKEGVFFGYVHQSKDSFFIQQLDADFCKITFIEDGLYGFAFNFAYFYRYPERLSMFPKEFQEIYTEKYKSGKVKLRSNNYFWEDLSAENTICIKFDETTWYPIPPFIGVFESLLDISDFKDLQKAKEVIDNYKLITMKLPINERSDQQDDYLVSADHALLFQQNVESVVPDQIGVATVPLEVDVIDFERDKVDKNKVADSTAQYFSEAGVSKLLFSSDSTGSVGVDYSVKSDENVAFTILRQIERWINRQLKLRNGTYQFRIIMPDVTRFNQQDLIATTLKNTQFGLPEKSKLLAVSGSSPSSSTIMAFFENDVLQLKENFVPLESSHTQSGSTDEGGAPKKSTKDLSDSGIKTRDNQSNENKL